MDFLGRISADFTHIFERKALQAFQFAVIFLYFPLFFDSLLPAAGKKIS